MFHRKSIKDSLWNEKGSEHSAAEEAAVTEAWDRHEQQVRREQARAALEAESNPRRTAMHQFFRLVCFCTGVSAFLMGTGQIVGITYEDIDILSCVMRGYVMVLCALIICNEAEWTSMVRNSRILRYWITRGLIYAFVGVIGLQQNDHATEVEPYLHDQSASLRFIKVVAWLMVAVGALYFVLGALCLQIYYNRLRRDFEDRQKRAVHVRKLASHMVDSAAAVV